MAINKLIEHTLLSRTATESDIIKLCIEAKEYKFHSICINGANVNLAEQLLKGSGVKICSVIGFPLGAMSTAAKMFEARKAIENGASEIDMVINIGLLKSRNNIAVLKDLAEVKYAVGRTPLTATIEISELSKNEIIRVSEICLDARVDFIKTSTGFTKSDSTFTAVKIIKKTILDNAKIKAFGEISDYDSALRFIELGAERLSTTTGAALMAAELEASKHLT